MGSSVFVDGSGALPQREAPWEPIVISKQERTSQKTGNRFAFVQCSDASGMYEVMLFSEVLAQYRDLLEPGTNVVCSLTARAESEQPRLGAQKVEKLDDVAARAAAGIKILVDTAQPFEQIRGLLDKAGVSYDRAVTLDPYTLLPKWLQPRKSA